MSSETTRANVVILGAGPAGTAAAAHLGTLGVRNVVLVGPSGAGKSRLFEHLVGSLAGSKAPRAGTDQNVGLRAATVEREGSAKPVCVAESVSRRYP